MGLYGRLASDPTGPDTDCCADGNGNYGCAENRMFPGQGPLQVGRQSVSLHSDCR